MSVSGCANPAGYHLAAGVHSTADLRKRFQFASVPQPSPIERINEGVCRDRCYDAEREGDGLIARHQ